MKKLNIYLCKRTVATIEECLKPLTEKRHYEPVRGNRDANGMDYEVYLVRGERKTPKWMGFVEPYIDVELLGELENITNSLVIFVKANTSDGERIFAISEGFGYHIIPSRQNRT